jgi:hypothetical protein
MTNTEWKLLEMELRSDIKKRNDIISQKDSRANIINGMAQDAINNDGEVDLDFFCNILTLSDINTNYEEAINEVREDDTGGEDEQV